MSSYLYLPYVVVSFCLLYRLLVRTQTYVELFTDRTQRYWFLTIFCFAFAVVVGVVAALSRDNGQAFYSSFLGTLAVYWWYGWWRLSFAPAPPSSIIHPVPSLSARPVVGSAEPRLWPVSLARWFFYPWVNRLKASTTSVSAEASGSQSRAGFLEQCSDSDWRRLGRIGSSAPLVVRPVAAVLLVVTYGFFYYAGYIAAPAQFQTLFLLEPQELIRSDWLSWGVLATFVYPLVVLSLYSWEVLKRLGQTAYTNPLRFKFRAYTTLIINGLGLGYYLFAIGELISLRYLASSLLFTLFNLLLNLCAGGALVALFALGFFEAPLMQWLNRRTLKKELFYLKALRPFFEEVIEVLPASARFNPYSYFEAETGTDLDHTCASESAGNLFSTLTSQPSSYSTAGGTTSWALNWLVNLLGDVRVVIWQHYYAAVQRLSDPGATPLVVFSSLPPTFPTIQERWPQDLALDVPDQIEKLVWQWVLTNWQTVKDIEPADLSLLQIPALPAVTLERRAVYYLILARKIGPLTLLQTL